MSKKVEYELSLHDMLTGKINQADTAVSKFEGTITHAKTGISEFAKVAVGAFAAFASFEFLKSSAEAYNEAAQASGQLEASLLSTKGAVGLTTEELEQQAKAMQRLTTYDDDAVIKMDSLLTTFTNVRGAIFKDAVPAILDMSTRLGQDLQGSALQVGKALNDPIQGINALRRAGVSFSESQREVIKNLVETGHMAQAQQMILKELNKEFGGSAEMAAQVGEGPLLQMQNRFGDLKEKIGEVVSAFEEFFVPILDVVIGSVSSLVDWCGRNKDILESVAIGVGVAAAALGAYYVITNAVKIATAAWTVVQWALNAAMTANPLGLIITAIGAVVAAVVYCWKTFAGFRATLMGVWEVVKEFGRIVGDIFQGLGKIIIGALSFDWDMVKEGWNQAADAMSNTGKRLGDAFHKGYDEGMVDFNKEQAAKNAPKAVKKATGAVKPIESGAKKETSKVTGNKSVNITINIQNLIKDFSIQTKNMMESSSNIKEKVTEALLSAVNDSQIVAGA